jgi:hypothetical protein
MIIVPVMGMAAVMGMAVAAIDDGIEEDRQFHLPFSNGPGLNHRREFDSHYDPAPEKTETL